MPLQRLGPYDLEKLLGRGGMGTVYAGVHRETGERAAIKLLSGYLADDESFRQRFKQEIDALKRLLHPNIVQLHGYGEEEGHLYYVMELVQGRTLQEELAAGRRFTWREVARIGIAIAQALKHAHDRGIIHRDLKPANLLIDPQDHVKLTDFGIAKLYGGTNVTAEGGVLGTADYMAPEQADGQQVTSRSDLYALGSVLFALLTGRPPFVGQNVVEVIAALQSEKPVRVRRLAPDTPEEFERLIEQLLEKDPQKRVPTALALANRLKAMEHGLSLETRIMESPDKLDDAQGALPDEALPSSAKTVAANPGALPTATARPDDAGEYRLASDAPTIVARSGAATPSRPTVLGTQAGRITGADAGGDRMTSPTPAPARAGHEDRQAGAAAEEELRTKMSRFTTVSAEDLRGRRDNNDESSWREWWLVGGLALTGLVVLGGAIFFATRPPSADRLYATVEAAAAGGRGEALVPVEAQIDRFLELYPSDPRAAEMHEHRNELARYRLERRVAARTRRGKASETPSPIERAYEEGIRVAALDPAEALSRFEALIDVYGGPARAEGGEGSTREHCLNLAREQIERLQPLVAQMIVEETHAVTDQLDRADALSASDPLAAEKIRRGIITLYGDKPWAEKLVERAQRALATDDRRESVP